MPSSERGEHVEAFLAGVALTDPVLARGFRRELIAAEGRNWPASALIPRPTFGPDRVVLPPRDADGSPRGPIVSHDSVYGSKELYTTARTLIAEYPALGHRVFSGMIEIGRRLDQVIERLREIDMDIAAEIEAKRDDPAAGDPADWGPETDDWIWATVPSAADQCAAVEEPAELLGLPDWIAVQATAYESLTTQAGDMIGKTLRDLASIVRLTGAKDPETAMDRLQALEDVARVDPRIAASD
jgi:hypothetical protein